tara:strand:+ start:11534 stop:12085 length:552 start_codon:yes stop_codon:yes gene_type:complete
MQPPILLAQTTQPQSPQNSQQTQADPFWAVLGQYGVGIAAFVTVLKMYADYQLKAAIEDRALKSKELAQSLELEGRVFGSLLSQQESSVAANGALLNTFISKALNQSEIANEQITNLIGTIAVLTEAIKSLGDTQQQQLSTLNELKGHVELELLTSIKLNTTLITQVLTLIESLVKPNINTEG